MEKINCTKSRKEALKIAKAQLEAIQNISSNYIFPIKKLIIYIFNIFSSQRYQSMFRVSFIYKLIEIYDFYWCKSNYLDVDQKAFFSIIFI